MSIQVENNLSRTSNKDIFEQKAHYIPCKIDEDGEAKIKQYFEPYIEDNGKKEYTSTFRGHPLDGITMQLPEGYRIVQVTEAMRPLNEDADRRFQVTGGFKEFTVWNWDKKPSQNDNIIKAMDWIHIANAIHTD